jgi:hypothetical protein
MGFPFYKSTEPVLRHKKDRNFIIQIDGKELRVEQISATGNISNYDYVYYWRVNFEPKERKVVECIYNIQWSVDPESYPDSSSLKYITVTGALWKDRIDEAKFNVMLDDVLVKLLKENEITLEIKPKGYKIIDFKNVKWEFADWEPRENISIIIWEK